MLTNLTLKGFYLFVFEFITYKIVEIGKSYCELNSQVSFASGVVFPFLLVNGTPFDDEGESAENS